MIATTAASPLFALPNELLEELSYYFSRSESVRVLTVNSKLHWIFASRVWRHIKESDLAIWRAPSSSWARYGHLVRSLSIPDNLPVTTRMSNLPHLLRLAVYLNPQSCDIFKHEMLLLQHVSIQRASFDSYQKSGAMAIAKWIAGSEQRNQDVDFEWTLSRSWHDTLNWLDEWVILINKPELHSFTLTISKDTLNGKHVGSFMAKVASVLVDLTINPSENTSIGDFKTFFHSTKDVVFSRLKQLYLQLPARSRDYSDNDAAVITARCFPVLESLDISESEYGKRESLSLMVDGYFTAAKYMQLEYCNNKLWNVFIKSVPNLETLNLYFSTVTINPAIMAAHLPKLEQLIIDSACDVSYLLPLNGNTRIRHAGEHNDQLKSLKILDTHCDSTTEDPTLAVLQFVLFYAPAIDTFRISYVFPSIEPIIRDNLHGATNNSLRRLSITYFIIMDFRVEQVETVVSLFPMLEKLHVTNFSPFDQPTEVLKERFPRLSIEPLI